MLKLNFIFCLQVPNNALKDMSRRRRRKRKRKRRSRRRRKRRKTVVSVP
jgi:hypothetical protein